MLLTSRSFAEYVAFFALDPDRLPRRVLDCSAGTSGFVAGARARGSDAVADGSFDLAVCSHLLFTWANVFDMAWHEAALREMARVATEVRVFPLVHQGSGEAVGFLGALRERLTHVETGIVTVPYAFQVGADEMLLVSRL